MYTKFISKNIQEKLKARELALARRESSLSLKDLSSRTIFVRMCSNKVDGVDNILISGGEHKKGGGIAFGFSDSYRNRMQNPDNSGIRGIPGIKDISVEYKGGFKAIREATINWSVPAIEDLDELTPYFLTVGKTVVVDWGWTNANKNTLQQQGINPFIEPETKEDGTVRYMVNQQIFTNPQLKILDSNGDYDAIGGQIKNFNYTLREDGGFDCTTIITSMGASLFKKPIDITGNSQGTRKITSDGTAKFAPPDSLINAMLNLRDIIVFEGSFGTQKNSLKYVEQFSALASAENQRNVVYKDVAENTTYKLGFFEVEKVVKKIADTEQFGIITDNINDPNILWLIQPNGKEDILVTWGWFEDQVLNRYLSYKGGQDGDIKMTMRSIDTVLDNNGNVLTRQQFEEQIQLEAQRQEDTGETTSAQNVLGFVEGELLEQYGIEGDIGFLSSLTKPTDVLKKPTLIRAPELLYPVNPFLFSCLNTNLLVSTSVSKAKEKGLIYGYNDDVKADKFIQSFLKITENNFGFKKKIFKKENEKFGSLRNIWVNIKEIQKAFGIRDPSKKDSSTDNVNPPGTLEAGVNNLLNSLNSNFHNVWKFEMVTDVYDSTNIKVVDTSDSEVDFPKYTNFETDFSHKVQDLGLYQFPSYKIGSIVKSQNLEFKIPDAQAITILYGSNKKKGESDPQQNNGQLDKLFRLDKPSVTIEGQEFDVYSDKFLNQLDTSNVKLQQNNEEDADDFNVISVAVGSENTNPNSKIAQEFGLGINPLTQKYNWRRFEPDLENGTVKTSKTQVEAYEVVADQDGDRKLMYVTRENNQDNKEKKILSAEDKSYYTYNQDTSHLTLDPPAKSSLNSFLRASSPTAQFDLNSLIPTELMLVIDGTGGIIPGDIIHTDYIQNKYKANINQVYKNEENEDIVERGPVSYFQLMGVTQTVDPSGWKTELKTKMRINKLPAEGILKYKVPKTDYVAGDDNVSNVKRIPPPPPRPFIPVPSDDEDIADDLEIEELDFEFEDYDLIPAPLPPHLDPSNPDKQFRPDLNIPSADEDIEDDVAIDPVDFDVLDDPIPPMEVPSPSTTMKLRRAKQEINLNPQKVPEPFPPDVPLIPLEFPEKLPDIPDNLGVNVEGNYTDVSYNNPEPNPKIKPMQPSMEIRRKPTDLDPTSLLDQINKQKHIVVQPKPDIDLNKKGEVEKPEALKTPEVQELNWEEPEVVVAAVNDNIKKEQPEEIKVQIIPQQELTILKSTYRGTYEQNEVLYGVREDWRPLYLQANGKPGGAKKDSEGNIQTLLRAAIPKSVRQEFFDKYIENPNKTGETRVNTTNFNLDTTPIGNDRLLRTDRSIYWYGEFNPNYEN